MLPACSPRSALDSQSHVCDSLATVGSAETWRETAAYWAYRGLEQAALMLPEAIGRRAFTALGSLACRRAVRLRATVAANQARVLGFAPDDARVARATREAFELYARYWYDTFRLRVLPAARLHPRVELRGLEHFDAALAAGKGCLGVLPHCGNWDVAGRVLVLRGYRVAVVAENLRPARLAALFRHHRERLGMRVFVLDDDAAVAEGLARLLADNWIVALVADRDLTGRGVAVEMFGAARRVPAGPAWLSLTTGAPLVAGAVYTTAAGWRIDVGAPLASPASGDLAVDVCALTRAMAAAFERAIAIRPPDWHLFQPAWDDAVGLAP